MLKHPDLFDSSTSPSQIPQLIIALDIPSLDRAMALVDLLGDHISFYKVGPVLFSVAGPKAIQLLIDKKKKVFVDLKFCDIPSVVSQSCKQVAQLGASLITIHITCGKTAIQSSLDQLQNFPLCSLLGVGLLTSLDQNDLLDLGTFIDSDPYKISEALLLKGLQWGLPGVVCSDHNLQSLKSHFPEKLTLIPGVRKEKSDLDQKRISSLRNFPPSGGPSFWVLGRPVINSLDPAKTVVDFLQDVQSP